MTKRVSPSTGLIITLNYRTRIVVKIKIQIKMITLTQMKVKIILVILPLVVSLVASSLNKKFVLVYNSSNNNKRVITYV